MIVKVKEPQKSECKMLREGQILFTYLHLAPDEEQVDMLLDSGCTAIAYETITDSLGNLPLLAPMSAIAGRMAIHVAAYSLHKNSGGSGILFGGVQEHSRPKVFGRWGRRCRNERSTNGYWIGLRCDCHR